MPWPNVCFSQAVAQVLLAPPSLVLAGQRFADILTLSPWQCLLVFTGGFVGSWSQIAMTVGMQREKSATATAMRMSDVVFGFIWQSLFTADAISGLSVLGALLVTSSIMVVVVLKPTASSSSSSSASSATVGEQASGKGIELTDWDSSAHAMLHADKFRIADSDDEEEEEDEERTTYTTAERDEEEDEENVLSANPLHALPRAHNAHDTHNTAKYDSVRTTDVDTSSPLHRPPPFPTAHHKHTHVLVSDSDDHVDHTDAQLARIDSHDNELLNNYTLSRSFDEYRQTLREETVNDENQRPQ